MKTILITGVNTGIGEALKDVFLEEGWRVIGTYRRTKPTVVENLELHQVELLDHDSIRQFVTCLQNTKIDVLLNNAGVYDATSVDSDELCTEMEEMADVFKVNTLAPRLLANSLLENVRKGSEKLIVTISSGMGTYQKMSDYHAHHWIYSASKAAVNYAMVAMGREFPDIKTALIHPGWVRTRVGGEHADIEPSESARAIFELITNHETKLPSEAVVTYEGEVLVLR